ncbi:uncharacterized protein LOC111361008 [Spodoptera litura]|uniref:Uncharacterized protein LOC111361008 n=1 Tax=Spodoptera litura TaxID=69820 RepID=A0A9J7IZW0_SPOLT|nr:uncharacterized protein LOC111361008 [Spodoptera litura]
MPIIQSCCCWRSLRRGCYASAIYTMVYFSVTIVTMGHFIDMEQRYLTGDATEPTSESFLEPEKITPITVSLNITLLVCSTVGLVACILLIVGVKKDIKYLLLPWVVAMGLETVVEVINLIYLFYLQTLNFNPITSFLFTLDFFIIVLNIYAMVCVISQFQEYLDGRGTAAFENVDRNTVQYTATAQQTTTTSSAPSGRRRSAARPMPSRCDPEEFSEAPTKIITPRQISDEYTEPRPQTSQSTLPSVLSRPSRSAVKKHVQFPDEQSCIEEAIEAPQPGPNEKPGETIFSMCPCSCHIFLRGTRHLLFVDGIGVGSSGARALTPAERAVLPASFPSSERASENVRSRSTARRRFSEGFPLN